MEHYSLDVTKRMKEIKRQLDAVVGVGSEEGEGGGASSAAPAPAPVAAAAATDAASPPPPAPAAAPAMTPAALELILEELVETVEDVDCARDLALIGGLPTLLALLRAGTNDGASSSSPPLITSGVVARAAEALGAAAQANPPVQDWFLDGGALEVVLGLLREKEGKKEEEEEKGGEKEPFAKANTERTAEVRQKALMALSCLVRNWDRGTDALIAAGGVGTVVAHALAAVGEEATGEKKGKGGGGEGAGAASAAVPAPRVARKAFQVLASLFRDRPTEDCLRPVLNDASFARAAARALRDGEDEKDGGAEVRLAAAAAVEALAEAASEAGLSLESSPSSPVSLLLLLRAALETAESSAKERAEKAAKRKDEHAKDWAEEEAAAAAAALGALSLKPGEKKKRKEDGEEPATTAEAEKEKPTVVLSLPAPP